MHIFALRTILSLVQSKDCTCRIIRILTTEFSSLITFIKTIMQFVAFSCLRNATWRTNFTGEFVLLTFPCCLNDKTFKVHIQENSRTNKYPPHISMFSSLPSIHSLCPSQTQDVGMQVGISLVQLKVSVEHNSSSIIKVLIIGSSFSL